MWTLDDTQFILENYYTLGANKCSELLGKTKGSVRNKASRLGIKSSIKKSGKDTYIAWLLTTEFELLEPFTRTSDLLLHKHTTCNNIWKVRPNNIQKGQGCPNCGKAAKLSNEQYKEKLKNTSFIHLTPYLGSDIKITHKHTICGHEWEVRPHDILRGQNCPKCSKRNYSSIAINWLNSFNNPNIIHAENGGEKSIAGYKVDGYDPVTNTVYEFHGDVYHGNLDIFSEDDTCHPFNKIITAGELWNNTFNKMLKLSELSTVIYIWERDYKNGKTFSRF